MIEFKQASKRYGDVIALDKLDLTVQAGEILGLIGHNGAGKSTTIKALVSAIDLSEGDVWVAGQSLASDRIAAKRKIGYVADTPDLFLNLSAYAYWQMIALAYDLTTEQFEERYAQLATLFDMLPHRYETIESFSHGMRQKVFVIGALLPNPDIWVLDEPLTGLDPQAAFDLKQLMREHADAGKTVLFSTHVLEVAEQICDRIAILKKGALIYCGTVEALKQMHPQQSLEQIYLNLAGRQTETVGE